MATFYLNPLSRSLSRIGQVCSFGLFLAFLGALLPVAASASDSGRLRIVFEFSNGQETAFDAFVANVEGLQENSGTLADITVVAISQGVGLLKSGEGSLQERLSKLADRGVDFVVCQKGLEAAGIESTDLLVFARIVRSGAEEVERLETQGWARVADGESYVSHL